MINSFPRLLRKTLNTVKDYKIVLVSTSTHVYWNLASVRGWTSLPQFPRTSNAISQQLSPASLPMRR
jgi:hypothetical protein